MLGSLTAAPVRTAPTPPKSPLSPEPLSSPIPVHNRAEAEGIARQVRTLASSIGGVTLPALFVPTPLEPDMSLALGLFPRALLPVLLDEAGAPLPGTLPLADIRADDNGTHPHRMGPASVSRRTPGISG